MQSVPGGTTEGKVNIALKVLQGNLGRSSLAQDLLMQTAFEGMVDLTIVSEQYLDMNNRGWYADITGTAALWVRNPKAFPVSSFGRGDGFVWVKSGEDTVISVYLSPNDRVAMFRKKLGELEDFARNLEGHVVMAGDFNAKALEWGMSWSCSRGTAVVEMAYRLDLSILNDGVPTTFRRSGCRGTIIDITLASAGAAVRIHDWRVMEDFNGSDHQHITFVIEGSDNRRPSPVARSLTRRWNVAGLDDSALTNYLNGSSHTCWEQESRGVTTRTDAESLTETTVHLINQDMRCLHAQTSTEDAW